MTASEYASSNDELVAMVPTYAGVKNLQGRPGPLLVRHIDHVAIIPNTAFFESLDHISHRAQQSFEAHAESTVLPASIAAVDSANELTGRINRQSCNVVVEATPAIVLKQILFDVRKVECGYGGVVIFQILPYTANRGGAAEITNQRHDQVLHFHVAYYFVI